MLVGAAGLPRAAEWFLREQLAEAFPGDGVLGEEEAPTPSTTGRRWILDPIDGTKAFTCGVPLYSTLGNPHWSALVVVDSPITSGLLGRSFGMICA